MISEHHILLVLATFFGLFGLLHFILSRTWESYAVDNGLLNAFIAVRMSGTLLVVGSILLFIEDYRQYGFYALTVFLILTSFILHKFWDQDSRLNQLTEFLHFGKNILLAILIWYLYLHL